jgi:hypothetical protein
MFDLLDVDVDSVQETAEPLDTNNQETLAELNQWADEQLASGSQAPAIFDIETGPRPLEEIECFYETTEYQPPPQLPPWDESMFKPGNAKRQELLVQKRDEQVAAYTERLANEVTERANHKAEWEAKEADSKAKWFEKAALSPVTGRVLLIGVLVDGKPIFIGGPDEAENLREFWENVDELITAKTSMIGHNSTGFDLPFLVRRSWALGVSVPREVRQGRYWHPLFKDTMEIWNCGGRDYIKLNLLGKIFGVGQKTEGVEGKDFSKLWFGEMPAEQWGTPAEQRAKAIEYNGQDLILTAAVAAKMGMV